MSNLNDFAMMQQLVNVKYRQQQESFARLMTQEARLRASLKQLDQQLSDSRSAPNTEQRAIGADVLWQGWIGRKKHALNMQLSQILAVKERHIAQVRKAYGKVMIIETLYSELRTEAKQKKAQSQLDRAISSIIF